MPRLGCPGPAPRSGRVDARRLVPEYYIHLHHALLDTYIVLGRVKPASNEAVFRFRGFALEAREHACVSDAWL